MNVGITFYNVFFFASASKSNTSKRPLLDVECKLHVIVDYSPIISRGGYETTTGQGRNSSGLITGWGSSIMKLTTGESRNTPGLITGRGSSSMKLTTGENRNSPGLITGRGSSSSTLTTGRISNKHASR